MPVASVAFTFSFRPRLHDDGVGLHLEHLLQRSGGAGCLLLLRLHAESVAMDTVWRGLEHVLLSHWRRERDRP